MMASAASERARILVVSDYSWSTGGTEEFVRVFCAELAESFAVELLTWSGAPPVPSIETTFVSRGDVGNAWAALSRADVVIVVASFNIRLLACLAAEYLAETRRPAITIVQTSGHSSPLATQVPVQELWLRALLNSSRTVVAVSEAVLEALGPLLGPLPDAPEVALIENGARLLDIDPPRRGRRHVAYIGRPTTAKGFADFHRIVALLTEDSSLTFSANTVSLPPTSRMPGVQYSWGLDDAELLTFLRGVDLLLVPYLRADGLPLAVLEALNCGVPVIGYDTPAVGPLLRRYGQLTVPCDPGALAKMVARWSMNQLYLPAPPAGQVRSLVSCAQDHVEIVKDLVAQASGGARERAHHLD